MKKTILILTILFFSLVIHAQSLITVNMTKVNIYALNEWNDFKLKMGIRKFPHFLSVFGVL